MLFFAQLIILSQGLGETNDRKEHVAGPKTEHRQ